MVFGASADVSGLPTTSEQRQLTGVVQKAWASFAEDPSAGVARVMGWPMFMGEDGRDSLVELGLGNSPTPGFVQPGKYDSPCSTVTLGALGTATASGAPQATS